MREGRMELAAKTRRTGGQGNNYFVGDVGEDHRRNGGHMVNCTDSRSP